MHQIRLSYVECGPSVKGMTMQSHADITAHSIVQLNNNVHEINFYLKITHHPHPIQEKVETTL